LAPAETPRRGQLWQALEKHLGSGRVSRVIYGAIIGLALVVALQAHPPTAWVMAGTLAVTALAVGLAELYSEVIGVQARTRRRPGREVLSELAGEVCAVAFGVAFPAVFFVLAALGAMELDTAFGFAKWSGLGLIVFYGLAAARLAGSSWVGSIASAAAVGAIGVFLIVLKSLLQH
jgi:tetrahydromethanopterin S-methyltransferase subunit B